MARRCPSIVPPLALSIALLSWSAACSRAPQPEAAEEEVVPTITADTGTVARATIAHDLVVRGSVAALPNEDVKVSALVAGRVDAVGVAEGDSVRRGDVVARIDTSSVRDQQRQAQAATQQATAQLENAQANLQRNQQLFTRGVAAGKEVEDAKMAVAQAQAALDQANAGLNLVALQLARADVRSPIAGQVVKRMVSVGEQVDGTAAQPIVQIANVDRVELGANVPAEHLAHMAIGESVVVRTDAYPDRSFDGRIVAVAPAVDPVTNTGLVRIRVENSGRLLKVGMFAEARVRLEEHKDALVVPASALVRDDEGAAVYVLTGDTATRTAVKTGLEQDDRVEVTSGVTEGQTILTSGVHGLGDAVKVAKPQ
ncbi:MAG TPA: efflux RND transporter periplasmic adaptor subunit [Vicinamibacterales bacterium]|nr:efflux RND transporter periplasmic adaptor subunit [Vicinamibacterales bacterium]